MALTFNNDGTKMYTSSMRAGQTGDKVYEYDLTTAYNISTATLRTSLDVGTYPVQQLVIMELCKLYLIMTVQKCLLLIIIEILLNGR